MYEIKPPFNNHSVVDCSKGIGGVENTDLKKFVISLINPSNENIKMNNRK